MIRACYLLAITFVFCLPTFAAEQVLEMKADGWKFLDTNMAPGDGWAKTDFDDAKWKSGKAPFGYGDDDIDANISFGDDEDNKHLCCFFRRTVEISDPASAKQFQGQLICDDGCAVYVNGEEVHRHNLPEGKLTETTVAPFTVGGEMERRQFTFLIDAAKLKAGANTIAVRVHQRSADSSDLAFDLALEPLTTDEEVAKAKEIQVREKEAIAKAIEDQENAE